jgi:hypothetical protein
MHFHITLPPILQHNATALATTIGAESEEPFNSPDSTHMPEDTACLEEMLALKKETLASDTSCNTPQPQPTPNDLSPPLKDTPSTNTKVKRRSYPNPRDKMTDLLTKDPRFPAEKAHIQYLLQYTFQEPLWLQEA